MKSFFLLSAVSILLTASTACVSNSAHSVAPETVSAVTNTKSPASVAQANSVSAADAAYDLKFLEEVTNISSETFDFAGVMQVQERFKKELEAMGFKTILVENPKIDPNTKKPISADMLVAEFPGKSPKFITLIGHADTVFKDLTKYSVSSDGKKIMGSGVGDDKGGVIVAFRALKMLLATGKPKYSIRVVITGNEEVGSPGMGPYLKKMAEDSYAVLGVEPSSLGNILIGRKGVRWYQADVTGVEAHAGVAHEKGVNACLDLSLKLAKVSALTDYNTGVTVNVGTVSGGKRANIVCGTATAIVDTRFKTLAQDAQLQKKFSTIFNKPMVVAGDGSGATTQTKLNSDVTSIGPFDPSSLNAPFIELYRNLIKGLEGLVPELKISGGGADISHMTMPHLIMMDGLGPFTDGSHTVNEYILVESMKTRPIALVQLLQAL